MPGSGVEHFILFLCLFVSGRTVVAHRANIYFTGRISQRGGHTALRPFPASFSLSPPFYLSFFSLLFFFFLFYFNRADRIFARERVPRRDYGKGREIPSLSGPRIYFFFSFSFFFPSRVGRRVGFEGWRFFGRRKRFGVEKKLGEKKFGGLRNGLANGPVFAKHGIHAAICRRCRFRWCVQKCLPLAYVTSASPPCIRLFTRYLLISLVPSLSLFLSLSSVGPLLPAPFPPPPCRRPSRFGSQRSARWQFTLGRVRGASQGQTKVRSEPNPMEFFICSMYLSGTPRSSCLFSPCAIIDDELEVTSKTAQQ